MSNILQTREGGGGESPIFLFGLGLGLEYIPAVLYLLHRSTNTYKGKTSTCLNYLKKKNKEYNDYEAREGRKCGGREGIVEENME